MQLMEAPVSSINPDDLDVDSLVALLTQLNDAYRRGTPMVSDADYDHVFVAALRVKAPDHPFLRVPEPEPRDAFVGDRYRHTATLLSTDKAYTDQEVRAFCRRVREAAQELSIDPVTLTISVTPKLDGIAGYDYGNALVTRGENGFGQDVSRLFGIGLVGIGGRGHGAGEIVVVKEFFDEQLRARYSLRHPRNFMAGLAGAETLQPHHREALDAGMCRFVPYARLSATRLSLAQFEETWFEVMETVQQVEYLCDGAVAAVDAPELRDHMGATSHHHRWQIATKRNDAGVETTVQDVRLTTGRTGRITPTLILEPVEFYGVTIRHATAHTAQHLIDHGLGPGARVTITRGGGVIPKLVDVIAKAVTPIDTDHCPSCGELTEWDGKYLVCRNHQSCPDQIARSLEHFFARIGVANGFGEAVTKQLVANGVRTVLDVYELGQPGLARCGVSPGVAANLMSELERSKSEPIAEHIFLAAFGIRHLGRGDAARLLKSVSFDDLGAITYERLSAIEGFASGTSSAIVDGLRKTWPLISAVRTMGFNLERVARSAEDQQRGPLAGQCVVFTGTMESGGRKDMESQAKRLGAIVGSSVTAQTTMLVYGSKVGATKTEKARKLGVRVLSEADYVAMLQER